MSKRQHTLIIEPPTFCANAERIADCYGCNESDGCNDCNESDGCNESNDIN